MFATESNYIVCDPPARPFGTMPVFEVADLLTRRELPEAFLLLDGEETVRGGCAHADAGELMIVDCRTQPFPGDMVLASFGQDFCVMRLWIEDGSLWLTDGTRPEIRRRIEPGRNCTLYGIVSGLARLQPCL